MRFLILRFGVFFFFIYLLKIKERFQKTQLKKKKLIANKKNSKAIPKSSSIKLTWAGGFVISSLHFKHMVMANYNALDNN
jgi:hypothetical protein